ncbi:unnamed protein product, partial [Discosporangium mesarthrocarpum]
MCLPVPFYMCIVKFHCFFSAVPSRRLLSDGKHTFTKLELDLVWTECISKVSDSSRGMCCFVGNALWACGRLHSSLWSVQQSLLAHYPFFSFINNPPPHSPKFLKVNASE